MTVYPSADHADFWAAYKQKPAPKSTPIPLAARDCFALLDDLQRICYPGVSLTNSDIGSIQAKLTILRINLNVLYGLNTIDPVHRRPDA
jgi:hypothetical protein